MTLEDLESGVGVTVGNQYLMFKLGNVSYALNIGQVQEVLELSPITEVPDTPPFVRGVINVRGSVVPVVDLKIRFKKEATEATRTARIIVMKLNIKGKPTLLGAIADSVREVIEFEDSDIEPPPSLGGQIDTKFVMGMGKKNDQFVVVLDVNNVFSIEDLPVLN